MTEFVSQCKNIDIAGIKRTCNTPSGGTATMSSRDNVLSRIRTALKDASPLDRPPAPEVWARTNPPVEQMVERFTQELDALAGETHRCASMDDARAKLA